MLDLVWYYLGNISGAIFFKLKAKRVVFVLQYLIFVQPNPNRSFEIQNQQLDVSLRPLISQGG